MKTKHLILYKGRPYLADGEEPKLEGYAIGEVHASTASQLNKHEKALEDWENSLEEPENKITPFGNGTHIIEIDNQDIILESIDSGQLVEVEGKRIIKLL